VLALDARIRLRKAATGQGSRLALRPYPSELEGTIDAGGKVLAVRPIRPEDGTRLAEFYASAPASDLRLRFFSSRREVPRSELARYCQIDYEREMTFVAMDGDRIAGEARAVCDPDNIQAEFAIQLASDWQRRGLGRQLMARLLSYLELRGTQSVTGVCLQENEAMARLARQCGFKVDVGHEGTLELHLALPAGNAPRSRRRAGATPQ